MYTLKKKFKNCCKYPGVSLYTYLLKLYLFHNNYTSVCMNPLMSLFNTVLKLPTLIFSLSHFFNICILHDIIHYV